MSNVASHPPRRFDYDAQTDAGMPITGSIDAIDADDARWKLTALGLRLIDLRPATQTPTRSAPLNRSDLIAFNEQLAGLAAAGLPVERGLRLIAADAPKRLAAATHALCDDLDRGIALPDAFTRHADHFPPLYARLIDAGVRCGNLSAVLLNLGRHLQLINQLHAALWRAAAYPLVVLVAAGALVAFIAAVVAPHTIEMLAAFDIDPPFSTRALFLLGRQMPALLIAFILVCLFARFFWRNAVRTGRDAVLIDRYIRPLPIIGPLWRDNLQARFCDAMKLAIDAGLDLDAAVQLAAQAVDSPALLDDSRKISDALANGQSIDAIANPRVLDAMTLTVIARARAGDELSHTLETLTQMHTRRAQQRLALIQTTLPPILLLCIANLLGWIIYALFAPLMVILKHL